MNLIIIIEYILIFLVLGVIIYKVINSIIEDIKEYRQAKEAEKTMLEFLFIVFIFLFLILQN